jgi:Fur family transcriptional regulator, stress-responsive regulator
VLSVSDLAAILNSSGLRVTPQRLVLLGLLLREGGHFTVDDLYQRARPTLPGLSPTSLYKSLHSLQRVGLVREVHVGAGPVRYDAGVKARHHHQVCRLCGRVEDVPCASEESVACVVQHEVGDFQVEQVELTYRGICRECQVSARLGSGAGERKAPC